MRFSLQVQYAICGSFDLAYNGGGKPVQIRGISERQAIPVRYLEQIFQRLRRAGLIHSKRGPGGGYTLAREPESITLREITFQTNGDPLEFSRAGMGISIHIQLCLFLIIDRLEKWKIASVLFVRKVPKKGKAEA